MPKGAIKVRSESWWAQKTTLEKVLLVSLSLAVILIIILIILLAIKRPDSETATSSNQEVCSKPVCITEAANILQHVDPEINPCTNLYKHACGTFLKNSQGDEKLALFHKVSEQMKREILELYKENNMENEHKMVKAAKNLFRACMNETEIARDNLRTIKEAIKLAGGWPVIDGARWIESNFDWIRSSAVLRKLGYYYSIFVDMQIDVDPNNASIPILKSIFLTTEAANILQHVDPEINPCTNLYKHACGTFLKNSHGDEKLALFHKVSEQMKREILELYKENNIENEHKMVKAAKNLFRACMNETEIARDNLRTIKEAIKLAGGWPVIEGARWIESNFDWIRSSAVLRKLGYYYSIFVDMQIDVDPNNASIPILKVVLPNLWDFSSRNFDKIDFMTEIAETFGALNRKDASMEMTSANAFLLQMQFESHSKHTQISYRKYTVDEYQQNFGNDLVDWLLFINNIVGRTAKITKDDYVLFPPPELFKSWFEFISKTSKRILANYMMWKVIEEDLPYLTEDLRDRKARFSNKESRDVFCLGETQRRFVPDPVSITYARRFLSDSKKKKIEQLVTSIKTELIETISNIKWLDGVDKKNLVERADNAKVIIGQPGNYFEDTMLNDIDVDMVETKNTGFLSLLAQASRNRQTKLYNQIKTPQQQSLSEKWYIKGGGDLPYYSEDDNILFIPTAVTIQYLFNEDRPQYLNYGALGAQISYQLAGVMGPHLRSRAKANPWSNKTTLELGKLSDCLAAEAEHLGEPHADMFKVEFILQQAFASVAYSAYEKWTKNNGLESKLVGVDYTPNKLYWLSTVSVVCQPGDKSLYYENGFSEFVRASPQFLKVFNCPPKTNHMEKCHVF